MISFLQSRPEEVETLKRLMRVMKTNLDQDEENTAT